MMRVRGYCLYFSTSLLFLFFLRSVFVVISPLLCRLFLSPCRPPSASLRPSLSFSAYLSIFLFSASSTASHSPSHSRSPSPICCLSRLPHPSSPHLPHRSRSFIFSLLLPPPFLPSLSPPPLLLPSPVSSPALCSRPPLPLSFPPSSSLPPSFCLRSVFLSPTPAFPFLSFSIS